MNTVNMKLTGQDRMLGKLNRLIRRFPLEAGDAAEGEANQVMSKSKAYFVPVATFRGGTLRDTGRVHPFRRRRQLIFVNLSYGSNETDAYAKAIHEHISRSSPPTWLGTNTTVSFSRGGPQYLKLPLDQSVRGMRTRLGMKLRLRTMV